jgi:hypothetical protein
MEQQDSNSDPAEACREQTPARPDHIEEHQQQHHLASNAASRSLEPQQQPHKHHDIDDFLNAAFW